jgi:hypothetical protein
MAASLRLSTCLLNRVQRLDTLSSDFSMEWCKKQTLDHCEMLFICFSTHLDVKESTALVGITLDTLHATLLLSQLIKRSSCTDTKMKTSTFTFRTQIDTLRIKQSLLQDYLPVYDVSYRFHFTARIFCEENINSQ